MKHFNLIKIPTTIVINYRHLNQNRQLNLNAKRKGKFQLIIHQCGRERKEIAIELIYVSLGQKKMEEMKRKLNYFLI